MESSFDEHRKGTTSSMELPLHPDLHTQLLSNKKKASVRNVWPVITFGLLLLLLLLLIFCIVGGIGWSMLNTEKPFSSFKTTSIAITSPSLNVLVIGDWGRKGEFNQSKVAHQMELLGEKLNIDFVISTGDNFYENGLTDVNDPAFEESFSSIYAAKSLPQTWHSVLGNHDYRGDALAQFGENLRARDPRWYCERSFSLVYELLGGKESSSVQFFFMDTTPLVDEYWHNSNSVYDSRGIKPRHEYVAKQIEDLSEGLQNSKASWKIVVGHHPIKSVGVHGDTHELMEKVYPILKKYDVDLYINGHDHCLQHISSQDSKMQFITSGGGSKAWRGVYPTSYKDGLHFYYNGQGFLAMSISPSQITMNFVDSLGNTLYDLSILPSTM